MADNSKKERWQRHLDKAAQLAEAKPGTFTFRRNQVRITVNNLHINDRDLLECHVEASRDAGKGKGSSLPLGAVDDYPPANPFLFFNPPIRNAEGLIDLDGVLEEMIYEAVVTAA